MTKNIQLWTNRVLSLLMVLVPLLFGIVYIGMGYVFRNFMGVQNSQDEIREYNGLVIAGIVMIVSGLLLPYKSTPRFYYSVALATVGIAMALYITESGDHIAFFTIYAAIMLPLHYLHKKLTQKN